MLYDPERHEPLRAIRWDEAVVRAAIDDVVAKTVQGFSRTTFWPLHAKDFEPGDDMSQPAWPMYYGAAGVIWALDYLNAVGAATLQFDIDPPLQHVRSAVLDWLRALPTDQSASYLMGDTPLLMMQQSREPTASRMDQLYALIERNIEHPARELMWGSPGTMLAALHLFERFGDARFSDLFVRTATKLRAQLEWSAEVGCHYWTQDLYGRRSTYLDAVHGFVATAFVLNRGRTMLSASAWADWEQIIVETIERTAIRREGQANWPPLLEQVRASKPFLMQFCHGSPGFVICLADLRSSELDGLLLEAGEATWAAGPLKKGSNLCHGTGGNGYAFLKLFTRTGDERWLERARAFAMHGIEQMRADEREHGQLRYSLWTGDPGFAIYLWDCLQGAASFPTLDRFYAAQSSAR